MECGHWGKEDSSSEKKKMIKETNWRKARSGGMCGGVQAKEKEKEEEV